MTNRPWPRIRDTVQDRPGVLHRSSPPAGTGQARLFLAINEAGD